MKSIAETERETVKTAQKLAESLHGKETILLYGPLGAGKSVFARALIRSLCGDESIEVPSPTFTLLQSYESKTGPIDHYDLYRVKNTEEIYELGWEDSLSRGITIVEWPERLESLTPRRRIEIRISPVAEKPGARRIEIVEAKS